MILKDQWLNCGFEDDKLKTYMEPPTLIDNQRIGEDDDDDDYDDDDNQGHDGDDVWKLMCRSPMSLQSCRCRCCCRVAILWRAKTVLNDEFRDGHVRLDFNLTWRCVAEVDENFR